MSIKYLHRVAAVALLLATFSVAAFAQVIQVSGKVTMRQADGSEVPVQNAIVEFFRTDIKGRIETKTNKNGQYIHAGIPLVGTFTIAVSAPGASPTFIKNVKISQAPIQNFVLDPGDGRRLTLDEINSAGSGAGAANSNAAAKAPAAETKEERAKREAEERERKRVEEENAKIMAGNEIVRRTFTAGNEALNARRYDEAITLYREGIAARPDEPALLANLSEALRQRGVIRYNAAIKATDANEKTTGLEAAKRDWTDAVAASQKALEVLKTQSPATDPSTQANQKQNYLAAVATRAMAMKFVVTKVDPSKAADGLTAYQEYIETEADPAKKAKLQGDVAQMLLDSGAADMAVSQAQKLLEADPESTDANRIMGLALFASGDKAKYQDAANYLQRFVDKAPDTDPLKVSAKEALDYLKTAENIKPQKTQPTRTTGRRRSS